MVTDINTAKAAAVQKASELIEEIKVKNPSQAAVYADRLANRPQDAFRILSDANQFLKQLRGDSTTQRLGSGILNSTSAVAVLKMLNIARNPVDGDQRAEAVNQITNQLKLLGVC